MQPATQPVIRQRVELWLSTAVIGKRPATVKYYGEIARTFLDHWPTAPHAENDAGRSPTDPSAETVVVFLQSIAHFSAPRFNALVSLLKYVFPGVNARRQRVRPQNFFVPDQLQFAALLRELDRQQRGHAALVVRFLALTGLRIGEARRLTWADVQPDCILLPGTVTKNGRPRAIPLIGEVREVLDRLWACSSGDKLLPQFTARKGLESACRRAGLPPLSHHSMRRLFATRCIESGVDLPTAARWLGHSDGGALLGKTYFHLLDGHSREMAGKVRITG